MNVVRKSHFKDETEGIKIFRDWVLELESINKRSYESHVLQTSLGKTQVWGLNTANSDLETLVIFPGARTTSLIWDLDRGLDQLGLELRIFLVETNGLPNLSSGHTPDIHTNAYGLWASEVLDKLSIKKTFVAGASFGGLIAMKLSTVSPEKIHAVFLLNPGCLQPFSLSCKNLYFNLLPIICPSERNVQIFLDNAIFSKPNHRLSISGEKMLIKYELFALRHYQDHTQKPYYMAKELAMATSITYLIEGKRDLLFPYQKSIANAKIHLNNLREVKVYNDVGHGIETYGEAIKYLGSIIKSFSQALENITR